VKGDFFNARWLPFTSDQGGNSCCLDLDLDLDPPKAGTRGQVIFFDHEDAARPVEARSFLAFLAKVE
jgi:cell wall assembly regulator SMI1